jgi:hypothetical protein
MPKLLNALERLQHECLPRMAREEAYSCWIAHFLMLEFGARRVIVESHHDGRALSSSLRQHLRPGCESWLPEAEGRGGAMNRSKPRFGQGVGEKMVALLRMPRQ